MLPVTSFKGKMADSKVVEELAPEKLAKFSISGSSINSTGVSTDENKPPEQSTKSKGPSRFKVARVDFAEDVGKPDSEAEQDVNDNKGKNYRRNRQESTCSNFSELSPQMSQDSYSGTHTGTHGYDTHNLKTFGQNTLETLPHMDHYRNLLSATGAMKKRPTLLELHEYDQQVSFILRVLLLFGLNQENYCKTFSVMAIMICTSTFTCIHV